MSLLRYTLLTDGSSDQVLTYLIDWLLRDLTKRDFVGLWADPQTFDDKPKNLAERMSRALENYPCDLLFVHRDAEKRKKIVTAERRQEIERATRSLEQPPPVVCVVPVRMTEAWLLIDEQALRRASGNPHGKIDLAIPARKDLETLADPKALLYQLLKDASERKGRRRKQFRSEQAVHRMTALIDDFSPLLDLPAFQSFRDDLARMLDARGWGTPSR